MPESTVLWQFFGVAILLALTPGPDNLFVLLQSAQHGVRAGLAVVVGLCLGIVGHTTAVALGLAALVAASAMAFTLLKVAGAAYLLWLAWHAWRAPVSAGPMPSAAVPAACAASAGRAKAQRLPWYAMVGRGIAMNLSNPKVLMFFLAFLPQFANPVSGPVAPQIVAFGAVFAVATLGVFGAIACFSGWFGRLLLQSARAQRILNRLAAMVFVALAARLLSMHRVSG